MKAPTKPIRPSKPYPPNKDKKVHKHMIDISHLFLKETYFDDNGKEISKEKYEAGTEDGDSYAFDTETEELTPSIGDLLSLVPAGTSISDVYIDLELGYDGSHNYVCRPFESISVFYTTPYSYQEELEKYHKQLQQYEKSLVSFNKKMKQYKEDLEIYRADKEKVRLEKKKASLKEQLSILEKAN